MKKRSVAILLAGILTVSTVCQSAYGAGTSTEAGSSAESIEARTDTVNASSEETDFEYTIKDDGTICISGYTGSGGDVVIPASIDGYHVTEIGAWAFDDFDCSYSLSSITIPEGVTKIGENAFSYCYILSSITIPESVTEIGEGAFCDCSSLSSITIPKSVTEIGEGAFAWCSSLSSITIPESVTEIEAYTFYECNSLSSITIPESVTEIGESAFYECRSLSSITIPEGVTEIGEYTFFRCYKLSSITIPEGVTKIGRYAFCGCSDLSSITIPEGVTEIGESAFKWCHELSSITIPEGVTEIGKGTFYDCYGLSSITIPEGVTEIGEHAFDGCSNLSSITIPESVTEIGSNAFSVCGLSSITIPEGVTKIGTYAFDSCHNLSSITIPEGVTKIEYATFGECTSLSSITIPKSVTEIDSCAFECCDSLTDVYYLGNESDWDLITNNGINLEKVIIHYIDSENSSNDYFELNKDNNNFSHAITSFYDCEYIEESDPIRWQACNTLYYIYGKSIPTNIRKEYEDEKTEEIKIYYEQVSPPGANYRTAYAEKALDNSGIGWFTIKSKLNGYWDGACLGVAASMVYTNLGLLENIFGESSYYDLGMPRKIGDGGQENVVLRDVINYYQLCQFRSDFVEDCSTYKKQSILTMGSVELQTFLNNLVKEAKKSQECQKPFILSFLEENEGGHSVIVCGYDTVLRYGEKFHALKIYDCNYRFGYLFFYIADDYSSFSFQGGNMISKKKGEYLENIYKRMSYIGIDTLLNATYSNPVSSTNSRSASTLRLASANTTVEISVPAFKCFKLTNAEGQTLIYDGESYSGTMQIYSNKLVGDTNAELFLTTDPSDSFVLTEFEDGVEVTAEIDGEFYDAMADGADRIVLSKEEGITITGDAYTFEAAISTYLDSCEMVRISGQATSITSITSDENGVHMDTELECANVRVETYQGVEWNEQILDSTIAAFRVTDDEETGNYVLIEESSGVVMNGTITSYGNPDDTVTVSLMSGDEEVSKVETTDGTYELTSVPSGTYTLQITKANHVTRTYEITVGSENITQDVKICLLGDVTGDGKVNTRDLNRIYAHVNGTDPLTGYEFACGDVTGTDNKVNTRDLNRLYAHINESNLLW